MDANKAWHEYSRPHLEWMNWDTDLNAEHLPITTACRTPASVELTAP